MRILLVEDELLIRLVIAEAIADEGISVVEAGTGDDAVELIAGQDGFDLVLTDMELPGSRDGAAVARQAKQRHPGIPILYMTGRPDVLERVTPIGPREAILRKPFGVTEVLDAIHRLLADTGGAPSSPG